MFFGKLTIGFFFITNSPWNKHKLSLFLKQGHYWKKKHIGEIMRHCDDVSETKGYRANAGASSYQESLLSQSTLKNAKDFR